MEVRVIANRGLAFGFFRFFARRNGAGLEGSLGGTKAPRSSGLELVERKVSGRRAFCAGAGGRIIAVPFPLKRGHWRLCGTELLTAEFAEEVAEDAEKSKRCSGNWSNCFATSRILLCDLSVKSFVVANEPA